MRTTLMTYEKLNHRLDDNRRTMGMEQTIERQIGGVMPVMGMCGGGKVPAFNGDPQSARFVSSYSLAEGARGYPRMIEYQVQPDPRGGLRLMMNEHVFPGPLALGPVCAGGNFLPIQITPESAELAGQLASCHFSYREALPDSPLGGAWREVWRQPNLPRAVRIEMAPLHPNPAQLPFVSVNVPIHITREVAFPYAD
jgi:hypothetical protein